MITNLRISSKIIIPPFILVLLLSGCEITRIRLSGDQPAYFNAVNNTVTLNGVLGRTAFKRFENLLEENSEIDTLIFQHVPGSENDDFNIRTALLLKQNMIVTKATDSSEIASGAVDLFLAGKDRIVEKNARIGVHSWRNEETEGRSLPKSSQDHQMFLDYYETIGIDSNFYWFTLKAATADSIHWMTQEEILKFEVATEFTE